MLKKRRDKKIIKRMEWGSGVFERRRGETKML
jgi:hypothetical protein